MSGFLHGASLSECLRPRAGEVPRVAKTVLQERISERRQVIEVPKNSCLDSVKMVKNIPQERSSERMCEQSESPDQLWQRMLKQ